MPNFESLTLREQLEAHRKKEACADCHRGIDPWGVALEHYDALGRWRDKTANRKKPVSAETVLPGNHPIGGVPDLQRYLLTERRDQFAHALAAKMLTYALGRRVDLDDEPLIDELARDFAANDYSLSSLMESVILSEAFSSR